MFDIRMSETKCLHGGHCQVHGQVHRHVHVSMPGERLRKNHSRHQAIIINKVNLNVKFIKLTLSWINGEEPDGYLVHI